jgi:hypothetical protein
MHSRLEQPIRPVTQQIADIHQDRREGITCCLGFGAWHDGHRRPGFLWREDLQPWLAGALEEERYAAVVGVRAGSHVFVVLVGCCCWGEDRGVVEVAEDAACWAGAGVVAGCEEVFFDLVFVSIYDLEMQGYMDMICLCLGVSRTSRPSASRVRIRVHVLLQSSANPLISPSWGTSEGGRGCWALPSLKSPKFMALGGVSQFHCILFGVEYIVPRTL